MQRPEGLKSFGTLFYFLKALRPGLPPLSGGGVGPRFFSVSRRGTGLAVTFLTVFGRDAGRGASPFNPEISSADK